MCNYPLQVYFKPLKKVTLGCRCEDGKGWWVTVGDYGGRRVTAEDGGGLPGTARVMSHDSNLAGTKGPSARTIVPYSPSGPYPAGRSPS